ncbi:MAG: prepilin-type N-terminal cleavage/methylation domain-containing protein [Candidatus Omnitrophica bacterium]|nr:prepilin-type N-terminal cleavage/methylation domain-containing protein [Candidatus Omnitrophota bacterium]
MNTAGRKGYTLVETLISVALGLLVIVAIGLGVDSGVFLASDNRYRLYSLNAMREELEILRRMNYDTLVSLGTTSAFTNAQTAKLPSGSGTRTIASTSFGADIKKVTLQVTWNSRRGGTLNQSLTTYVTRRGVNGS